MVYLGYWLTFWGFFFLVYFLVDRFYEPKTKKKIRVAIIDEDGTKRVVEITQGKDPEIERLIKQIRSERGVSN